MNANRKGTVAESKPECIVQEKRKIFWYGIPAYGHIHSNLYFADCLSQAGFQIIYYSTEEFQTVIEANGCVFRSYPIRQEELDLSDGQRILKLYRLILQYTADMLPTLTAEAEKDQPACLVFDSLALWGRIIKERRQIPGFSFYSIAAIDPVSQSGLFSYCKGFFAGFLRHVDEIPRIISLRQKLCRLWGKTDLSMMAVLMNRGDQNLMGYSRLFQPGGRKFGESYLFLGPLAVCRKSIESNDFSCAEGKVIYISLGTIFNNDDRLLKQIIKQLGMKNGKRICREKYSVILVWNGWKEEDKSKFPDNFIVRKYVNQGEVLQKASLFISAGGLNSLHEALYYGVPCLICPQQGEQQLNAERFEKLGFGRILRNPRHLYREAILTMNLKNKWNEPVRKKLIRVSVERGIKAFRQL